MMQQQGPIGIFDSGYGGLTILKEIEALLPQYDYLYLGDNARSPYGTRSFETVYQYTLQCVQWFFKQGCSLVIIACNTASAKALRTIQQKDLPLLQDDVKRVLGVIRPTAEIIGQYTTTNNIGILATKGTVLSNSYVIEMEKYFPKINVYQQACPMWVPLIENNEHESEGANYFVQKEIQHLLHQQPTIDAILLACTHYPLLLEKIKKIVPATTTILSQGSIVAASLQQYLQKHTAIENRCSKNKQLQFYTTDSIEDFNNHASMFFGKPVLANHVDL